MRRRRRISPTATTTTTAARSCRPNGCHRCRGGKIDRCFRTASPAASSRGGSSTPTEQRIGDIDAKPTTTKRITSSSLTSTAAHSCAEQRGRAEALQQREERAKVSIKPSLALRELRLLCRGVSGRSVRKKRAKSGGFGRKWGERRDRRGGGVL